MILRILSLFSGACLVLGRVGAVTPDEVAADTPVSQILKLAASALGAGSPQDALAFYDLATTRDPQNYLTFFKRGATYLSLGRTPQASADFDKVLKIKPGFEGALTQRAKIRARSADWKAAIEDYTAAKRGPDSEEIQTIVQAEDSAKKAKEASKKKDWEACVTLSSAAIMTAVAALPLRNLRVHCRFEKGEIMEALGDLNAIQTLNAGATEPPMQIAAMTFYSLGETDKGIESVKKCLHSDPDSKRCSRLFKKQKSIRKSLRKINELLDKRSFSSAVRLLSSTKEDDQGLIERVKEDMREYRLEHVIHPHAPEELLAQLLEETCHAYLEMNNHKRAQPFCTDLLSHRPNALSGLIHRAQAQMDADDFEASIRTLKEAKEHGGAQDRRVNDMLQKAQTLLKRSKTKDYYAILGVSRDASAKEIKKAYRSASKTNHPDKVASPEARPAAEKKMAAINEAYEVLSDPDLKQRFDLGEDPMDPMSGQQGGGDPFGGQNPFAGFGGGGGQRQFVFRQGGGNFKFEGGGFPFG